MGVQGHFFSRTAHDILAEALRRNPRAIFVGFSGGNDSLAAAHWMMANVPDCQIFHANTGIGIEATRDFVRETCAHFGWKLTEIRAKEDCGQDYDAIVRAHGFPGPSMHFRMYQQLKERPIRLLVKHNKVSRRDRIMIATGIRYDESQVRTGYVGGEINFVGSQMWVNPLYWWSKQDMSDYLDEYHVPRNPVSQMLGMSGECLCGAFAHAGEKALIRMVCPATADRIERLEREVKHCGHSWGWEERPPRKSSVPFDERGMMPFCMGCEK